MIIAATIALVILAGLSLFQIALIFRAPLGRFAWGGQHEVLPARLRLGSALSLVIYALFALAILSKSEILTIIPLGETLNTLLWVMFAYLSLGVIMNAVSRSKPERYTMTPTALTLAICIYIIVAS